MKQITDKNEIIKDINKRAQAILDWLDSEIQSIVTRDDLTNHELHALVVYSKAVHFDDVFEINEDLNYLEMKAKILTVRTLKRYLNSIHQNVMMLRATHHYFYTVGELSRKSFLCAVENNDIRTINLWVHLHLGNVNFIGSTQL